MGDENRGLAYMFHMMNEARIGVGVSAVALGYTGYLRSLEYARTRTQGRPLRDRDPSSVQIPIIEHTDVRRMLLAQKSYVEGGLALSLYCAALLDEQLTAPMTTHGPRPDVCWTSSRPSRRVGPASGVSRPIRWPSRCTVATATPAITRWNGSTATTG